MLIHMNILVELDAEMAARLERIAPARSRRRSEFIRAAIRKALWELEEQLTANAYSRIPDSAHDAVVEPSLWEAPATAARSRRRRATSAKRPSRK